MCNKNEIEKKKGKEEKKRKLKKERGTNRKERERENKWYKMIQNDNNWIIWTDNNIGAEGARMISEALKTNTTLTTLDLGSDENEVKWKQTNK